MNEPKLSNPAVVAERGEAIYKEKYQAEFEKSYPGWFVLIDVTTGNAYYGPAITIALEQAQEKAPQGTFHVIRVGERGAFKVSYRRSASEYRVA
jgi:hypothetical protein